MYVFTTRADTIMGVTFCAVAPEHPLALHAAKSDAALAAFIVVYSMLQLYWSASASPLEAYGGSTGDAQVDELVTSMTRTVSYGLYGTMAVLGLLIPGLTAWYYHSRGPKLRRFAASNPAWVIDALRAAA